MNISSDHGIVQEGGLVLKILENSASVGKESGILGGGGEGEKRGNA